MKHKKLLVLLVLLLGLSAGCLSLFAQQQALASKLIRFHVVANSDGAKDQRLKLAVRDALMEDISALSSRAHSREEMTELIKNALPRLKSKAVQTVRSYGGADAVSISLRKEDFPTRYYQTFTLPAGSYLSLRVSLGEGQGHNWWCVCFPSLCTGACVEDLEAIATGGGFSEDEVDWITNEDKYVIRFRLLEWLQKLKG